MAELENPIDKALDVVARWHEQKAREARNRHYLELQDTRRELLTSGQAPSYMLSENEIWVHQQSADFIRKLIDPNYKTEWSPYCNLPAVQNKGLS